MKKIRLFLFVFIIVGLLFVNKAVWAKEVADITSYDVETTNIPAKQTGIADEFTMYYEYTSRLYEFWDNNQYNIIFEIKENDTELGWLVLDSNMNKIAEYTIPKKFKKFGNATAYNGYLYVVTGRANPDKETDSNGNTYYNFTTPTIDVSKYSIKSHTLVKSLPLAANETLITGGGTLPENSATREPFKSGNCHMAVNKNGILKVIYSSFMYVEHQMSHQIIIDTTTMTQLNNASTWNKNDFYWGSNSDYWISHTMAQRILAMKDGGFFSVDQGDANPRGFIVTRTYDGANDTNIKRYFARSLHFTTPRSTSLTKFDYNYTYAKLGNIIDVGDGVILVGATEKTITDNNAKYLYLNESSNLFVQKLKSDIGEEEAKANSKMQMLDTEPRTLAEDATTVVDRGVKWLTNYDNDYCVLGVRAVEVDNDRVAILYVIDKMQNSTNGDRLILSGKRQNFYMVIDKNANIVQEPIEIKDFDRDIVITDEIDYVYKDGYVYWTSTPNNKIVINKLKLYTKNNIQTHMVNFNSRVGIPVESQEVANGKFATKPTNPYIAKRNFDGWYTDEKFSQKFDFNTMPITKDITLYGRWYTSIYIYSDSGEKGLVKFKNSYSKADNMVYTFQEGNTATIMAFPNSGYNFKEWRIGSVDGEIYSKNSETEIKYGLENNVKYYAIFEEQKKYTVKFMINGLTASDNQIVISGNKAIRPNNPTKENLHFDDWYEDANFINKFDFNKPIDKDTTIYGRWMANLHITQSEGGNITCSGTVDSNGNCIVEANTYVTLGANPSEGYEFQCWKNYATGEIIGGNGDTTYNYFADSDLNISAVFKRKKHIVKYENNGHGLKVNDKIVEDKNIVELPILQSEDGYNFIGWYLEKECINKYAKNPITEDITLYAKWERKYRYPDVTENDWFYNSVEYVSSNNMMNGYTAGENIGKFGPNDNITRGQIVTILYRRENTPDVSALGMKFNDVGPYYYYDAIKWAEINGIVTGYTAGEKAGKFGPDDLVTREQLAVILQRYAKYKNKSVTEKAKLTTFFDYEKVSPWALEGLEWVVAKGIITGDKQTNPPSIKPQGNATRAEAATMIMRFCENVK